VRLFPATSGSERISFHQLAPDTKARIRLVPTDPTTDKPVPRDELLRGYEYDKGHYVIVSDEEIEKIEIESNRIIDVMAFVEEESVDPLYIDTPYWLAPDGHLANEAFRVIAEAMHEEKKAGVARLVLSSRERVVLLTPRHKGIMVRTLRAPDEVRQEAAYFEDIEESKLDPEMVKMARGIIAQKSAKFDPKLFVDRYQQALRELVESKIKGKTFTAPEVREPAKVINLMDALRRSLGDAKPPARSQKRSARAHRAQPRARKKAS
jgi:DNA end-binding protein Ku